MAQHVEPAGADRDVDTSQDTTVHLLAIREVDRGLDQLVTRAIARRADVDDLKRGLVADQVQDLHRR